MGISTEKTNNKKYKIGDKVYIEAEVSNIISGPLHCYNLRNKEGNIDDFFSEEELTSEEDLLNVKMLPEEVWEIAKKITLPSAYGGYSAYKLEKVFGTSIVRQILNNFTPQECKQKIEEYEYNNTFNPSDVIQFGVSYENDGIVVNVHGDKDELNNCDTLPILTSNGEIVFVERKLCRKTGQQMNFEHTFESFELQREKVNYGEAD